MIQKEQELPLCWIPDHMDPEDYPDDTVRLETIECDSRVGSTTMGRLGPKEYYCEHLNAGKDIGLSEYCVPAQLNKDRGIHPSLQEAIEYKNLQAKQPGRELKGYWTGGRVKLRRGWEVIESDYDSANATGTVLFEVAPGRLWLEVWDHGERIRGFHPQDDLESYCRIAEERGWEL